MLSRALSLATVTLLIGCLTAAPAHAQVTNLEAGKSPSQIFAGTCTACHKSPRGLLKTVPAGSLPSFLRQHYTTSPEMAWLLSSYLTSNGAADTRYGSQTKPDKDAKSGGRRKATPAARLNRSTVRAIGCIPLRRQGPRRGHVQAWSGCRKQGCRLRRWKSGRSSAARPSRGWCAEAWRRPSTVVACRSRLEEPGLRHLRKWPNQKCRVAKMSARLNIPLLLPAGLRRHHGTERSICSEWKQADDATA